MTASLRELERQLRSTFGAWNHYRLRVWRECRSFDAAGVEDRIRVAKKVLADPHRGELVWAWGGFAMLLGETQSKLNDPDPHVRADAIVALVDFGLHARNAVPLFLDRLRTGTIHERTLAAWVLPRIGASEEAVAVLLAVLDEAAEDREADELRLRAVEAVERLSESFRVLVPLARCCLRDRYWRCRLHGLDLFERLVRRERRLKAMLSPSVEVLVGDEAEEVRVAAQRIVSQSC